MTVSEPSTKWITNSLLSGYIYTCFFPFSSYSQPIYSYIFTKVIWVEGEFPTKKFWEWTWNEENMPCCVSIGKLLKHVGTICLTRITSKLPSFDIKCSRVPRPKSRLNHESRRFKIDASGVFNLTDFAGVPCAHPPAEVPICNIVFRCFYLNLALVPI